mmetsp:Transcript_94156/g.224123  ORF Transcript_94156/g.224123 Transcript_94156/m.224123 type:complete len:233 (-) Transcript_94156:1987-2685(-)
MRKLRRRSRRTGRTRRTRGIWRIRRRSPKRSLSNLRKQKQRRCRAPSRMWSSRQLRRRSHWRPRTRPRRRPRLRRARRKRLRTIHRRRSRRRSLIVPTRLITRSSRQMVALQSSGAAPCRRKHRPRGRSPMRFARCISLRPTSSFPALSTTVCIITNVREWFGCGIYTTRALVEFWPMRWASARPCRRQHSWPASSSRTKDPASSLLCPSLFLNSGGESLTHGLRTPAWRST